MPKVGVEERRKPRPGDVVQTTRTTSNSLVSPQIQEVRDEIDGYIGQLQMLTEEPEMLRFLSSMSSRLLEIRTRIQRSDHKDWQNLRTREIDPLLDHVDRLFKIASRLIAVQELEWQQARGQ